MMKSRVMTKTDGQINTGKWRYTAPDLEDARRRASRRPGQIAIQYQQPNNKEGGRMKSLTDYRTDSAGCGLWTNENQVMGTLDFAVPKKLYEGGDLRKIAAWIRRRGGSCQSLEIGAAPEGYGYVQGPDSMSRRRLGRLKWQERGD